MKNFNKLLIVFISVVFIASIALPQSDAALKKDQAQKKSIPETSYKSYQGLNFTDKVPQNVRIPRKATKTTSAIWDF